MIPKGTGLHNLKDAVIKFIIAILCIAMKKGEIMSKQIFFFLLPEDIKNVLKNIHEKYDLQYLRTGSFTEDEIKRKNIFLI